MVKKISILRTEGGATISIMAGDHVYREAYDSWDQALHDVVSLHSWTQEQIQDQNQEQIQQPPSALPPLTYAT